MIQLNNFFYFTATKLFRFIHYFGRMYIYCNCCRYFFMMPQISGDDGAYPPPNIEIRYCAYFNVICASVTRLLRRNRFCNGLVVSTRVHQNTALRVFRFTALNKFKKKNNTIRHVQTSFYRNRSWPNAKKFVIHLLFFTNVPRPRVHTVLAGLTRSHGKFLKF